MKVTEQILLRIYVAQVLRNLIFANSKKWFSTSEDIDSVKLFSFPWFKQARIITSVYQGERTLGVNSNIFELW